MHKQAATQDGDFQEITDQLADQDAHWKQLRERLLQAGDVEFAIESPPEVSRHEPVVPVTCGIRV